MPLGGVAALLESRAMATTFVAGAPVYAKRQDGHTIPIKVDAEEPLDKFEERVAKLEVRCNIRG